jgi:DNA-binding NarL/FixJ family response regulator
VAELQRAAAALDACGAWRYRQSAERELGKLGHRPHRRTRPGQANGAGIESLTGRELQVARLVADRKTNPEIALELFLSQKTVETHLRNIFHKMGVTTRTALARAVERADPAASARPVLARSASWSFCSDCVADARNRRPWCSVRVAHRNS